MRTVTIAGAVLALAAPIGAYAYGASTTELPPRTLWMRTVCPTSESIDCAWNGRRDGSWGVSYYTARRPLIGPHGHRVGRVVCVYIVGHRGSACHLLPKGEDGTP